MSTPRAASWTSAQSAGSASAVTAMPSGGTGVDRRMRDSATMSTNPTDPQIAPTSAPPGLRVTITQTTAATALARTTAPSTKMPTSITSAIPVRTRVNTLSP